MVWLTVDFVAMLLQVVFMRIFICKCQKRPMHMAKEAYKLDLADGWLTVGFVAMLFQVVRISYCNVKI